MTVTRQKYRDGSTGLTYVLRNELGSTLVFKGATQLNYALSPADLGKWIHVKYVGEDDTREVAQFVGKLCGRTDHSLRTRLAAFAAERGVVIK